MILVIKPAEDGPEIGIFKDEAQFLIELNAWLDDGKDVKFLRGVPSDLAKWLEKTREMLVIRGDVIVPKPEQIITKYVI